MYITDLTFKFNITDTNTDINNTVCYRMQQYQCKDNMA